MPIHPMIHFRLLLLSLFSLLAAACASTSAPPPQTADAQRAASSFQPVHGTAGLYIFKQGVLLSAVDSYQIALDGRLLGLVAANSYLYAPLAPGPHIIASGSNRIELKAMAGRNYYIQQTPRFDASGLLVSSDLALVAPKVAQPQIKQIMTAPTH